MIEQIKKNQSLDYIHQLTKELSLMGNDNGEYGFRVSGSSGEWKVSRRIEEEMKAIGLKGVTVDKFPVHAWEFRNGKLQVGNETLPMSSYCGIKGTPKEGVLGEIIDVGRGTIADYEGLNVKNKIVLCTFDLLDDYWISLPVYQAELRGAKGCIISYAGDFYGTKDDAINCFDSQCKHSLPTGNISRKSANMIRQMLQIGPVKAKMTLTIDIDFNGTSSNVVGYIPGEDKERMILLGGHMDGYFHSYQDDLLGVGIILGIAKAMIQSGFKPKHTIAFIAHGSEEYGVTESRYDWCIGSWNSINKIHPEWFGRMIAFFNIDAIRPGAPVYNIASTPEYHGFFEGLMKEMDVPKTPWKDGSALLGLNGPWSDDYNYAINGIPSIICGRGPAEWSYQNYHTQFDDYTIFEEEKEIISYVAENYTNMVYAFDQFLLPPLNFKHALEGLNDGLNSIDDNQFKETVVSLKQETTVVMERSVALFKQLVALNEKYTRNDPPASLMPSIGDERKRLMEIYKLIQGDLMKLSPWDDVSYAHTAIISNIIAIKKAISCLEDGKIEQIVEDLWEFDLFKVAYQFDKEVYDWLMKCQDHKRDDLYWGTGKVHKFAQLMPLVEAIRNDQSKWIQQELEDLLDFEHQLLQETLTQEIKVLIRIKDDLSKTEVSKFL